MARTSATAAKIATRTATPRKIHTTLFSPPAGKSVGCLVFLTNHEVNRTHHGTAVQNAALAARTTKASQTSLALRVRAVNVRGAKDLAAGPPERLAARGVGG